ncbi:Ribonucleases P/MRP protein subunit POP1 [Portunus trituberculatus]|uniref:Ribonucleases P/MRP protein subunit POP1 n=1 Tax=Portunus trituberculatus TaxID=210409 RepID=A0A5B7JDL1_PORTR|nr:Ribonucleases P/MRP protein subunit POP1 [Portunus trituberculatus]
MHTFRQHLQQPLITVTSLTQGGGSTKPSHRPRRKYRRRPANLLQEYNRRQKKYVWLETHVWHAKRFHMHRQWGYALPRTPTCRGYRASLRAATTGCLLQDVSYLCCIELVGVKSTILQGLSRALQPESLATLTSPEVLAGRHWLSSVFFQPER